MLIEDFGPLIAQIQIRYQLLIYFDFSEWDKLPALNTWKDSQGRYALTLEDYQALSDDMLNVLKHIYRNRRQKTDKGRQ